MTNFAAPNVGPDTERDQVAAATERLLSGNAIRSSGRLTVVALAEEAGLNRTRLYERHADLVAEFKGKAGLAISSPTAEALAGKLETAQTRIAELLEENRQLENRVRTLSAILVELSLEHHNQRDGAVVALRGQRRP